MGLDLKNINWFLNKVLKRTMLVSLFAFFLQPSAFSAGTDEEVVLSFSHPAVGQYYINTVYSNRSVYLPVMELFNLLYVHYEKGSLGFSLQGTWLNNDNNWQINTTTLQASIGKERFALTTEDFRIGELDLYLSPSLFEKMFGLRFTVDLGALSVRLESDKTLPVEEKKQHEDLRRQLERKESSGKDAPLLYPRNRKVAAGGLVDYNLMMIAEKGGITGSYTVSGGMEFLGGDLQGTVYGAAGETSSQMKVANLNWRFAVGENPFLTSFKAGQLYTTGLQSYRIVGGAISNDPIEPRKVYNTYSTDGYTVPDSEVELYVNNQLTNFTRSDELGYYRFNFSLTYGTVRIRLRIYTPTGQVLTEERQIQIPFTFLPKGVVSYNLQAGAIDDGITELNFERHAVHGDVAWGLTNTLTAKAGTDYTSFNKKPFYYGSLSARVFDQYLFNLDIAPNVYYRSTASVSYASSRSLGLVYTKFLGDSLFNPRHARGEFDAAIYMPFRLLGLQSGIRLGGEHFLLSETTLTSYNADFNTRLGRFNIRANYMDQIASGNGNVWYGKGLATGSITFTFSHTPGVPLLVKGMFLRAQAQYDVHNSQAGLAGIQFSRTVLKNGRINVSMDHDLRSGSTLLQAGFTFDLMGLRSSTQYAVSGENYAFQQSIYGSVGLDAQSAKLTASNREQVGRAAVSVLMFVDTNNNGHFDQGEEKVPARALRLSESALLELGKDSILRITQLQSYWRYNAEIVQSALPNPTLAPISSEFAFVADPNRYKRIEIPLYPTGTIEGSVVLQKDGSDTGLGGLRLIMKRGGHSREETIRTFSDGGFYAMNLLPGKYTLEVDPVQLTFLHATCQPEKLEFEIRAQAGGDYKDSLNLKLIAIKTLETLE